MTAIAWIELNIKLPLTSWRRDSAAPQVTHFLSLFPTRSSPERSTSLVNPHYVSFVGQLVEEMVKQIPRLPHIEILILSYYTEERKALSNLFRKLHLPDIRVQSVASSQGSESSVVVLSTTRPGFTYGLGFLMDRNIACVAFSRAKDCLIVVGDIKMSWSKKAGQTNHTGNLMWSLYT